MTFQVSQPDDNSIVIAAIEEFGLGAAVTLIATTGCGYSAAEAALALSGFKVTVVDPTADDTLAIVGNVVVMRPPNRRIAATLARRLIREPDLLMSLSAGEFVLGTLAAVTYSYERHQWPTTMADQDQVLRQIAVDRKRLITVAYPPDELPFMIVEVSDDQ